MRYGRLYKGVVVSVTELPPDRTLEQSVGAEQADHYVELPDDVSIGFYQQTNGSWLTPDEYAAKKTKALQHVTPPH